MFNYGFQWRQSLTQLLATFKTIVYPAVIWATLLQTVMGIGFGAAGQVTSFALLASGLVYASFSSSFPSIPLLYIYTLAIQY